MKKLAAARDLRMCLLFWIAFTSQAALAKKAPQEPPSTTVNATPQAVKTQLVTDMFGIGFHIESESEHQLVFSRVLHGKAGFAATLLMGNAYSEDPKQEVRYTISSLGDSRTRIDAASAVIVKMAFGKENRSDMTNGKIFRQDMQVEFQRLQSLQPSQEEPRSLQNAQASSSSPVHPNQPTNAGASITVVQTVPSGASVYVDGKLAGLSPVTFLLLKRDADRVITVSMPGYKNMEMNVAVTGEAVHLEIQLEKIDSF